MTFKHGQPACITTFWSPTAIRRKEETRSRESIQADCQSVALDRLRCESLSQAAHNEHWSNGYNSYQAARQRCHVYATTRMLQQWSGVAFLVPPYRCPELVVWRAKATIDSVLTTIYVKRFAIFFGGRPIDFSFIAMLRPFHHHRHHNCHHHFYYHTSWTKWLNSKHLNILLILAQWRHYPGTAPRVSWIFTSMFSGTFTTLP